MRIMLGSFIIQLVFLLSSLTNPVTPTLLNWAICSTSGNYTSTSSFLLNLNKLLSTLPTNALKNDWFFNDSAGEAPDIVYGLAMCHYDALSTKSCTTCLKEVARNITIDCPYSTTAVLSYDECLIRYSNQNFFSEPSYELFYWRSGDNVSSDPDAFLTVVGDLMYKLTNDVVSSPKLVAVGEANYSSFQKVYGLVEGTRDLSVVDCKRCLQQELGYLPSLCPRKIWCHLHGPNCYLRYDAHFQFYNPIAPVVSKGKKVSVAIIIAVACAAAALLLMITVVYFFIRRKRTSIGNNDERSTHHDENNGDAREENFQRVTELVMFDFNTIKNATSNFSDENKLGEGGFGQVFKGTLQNGRELAVKRLATTSVQGITELKNEVELLGKLRHKNLVQVLGYCIQENEKLLCYEYLRNGSLDKVLFVTDITLRKVLDWKIRFNIIEGICRGLVYLHVESGVTIIHRDLKASNILLDKSLNPKISDFGLARLFSGDNYTHINTVRIARTFGYIAPEYLLHLTFSPKSDVFSFGVLVLEIVTGRRCSTNLISNVWQHWKRGEVLELKDPLLPETCLDQVAKCIHIGLLCVQEKPEHRPDISEVNLMLHSHPSSLPPLPLGNFIWGAEKATNAEDRSSLYASTEYTSDGYYQHSIHTR